MKRGIVGLTYVGALVLAGFFLIPSFLAGQGSGETFTATATLKAAGKDVAEPVKIVIDRYLTDAERMTVMDALNAGGSPAAREVLEKMPDIGSPWKSSARRRRSSSPSPARWAPAPAGSSPSSPPCPSIT